MYYVSKTTTTNDFVSLNVSSKWRQPILYMCSFCNNTTGFGVISLEAQYGDKAIITECFGSGLNPTASLSGNTLTVSGLGTWATIIFIGANTMS